MIHKRIGQLFDLAAAKEDCRKIGINFLTAGVVGVFIDHYVGSMLSTMFWASESIATLGVVFLAFGLWKFSQRDNA